MNLDLSNRGLSAAKIFAWNSACFSRSDLSAMAETVAATAWKCLRVVMGSIGEGLEGRKLFVDYFAARSFFLNSSMFFCCLSAPSSPLHSISIIMRAEIMRLIS